MYINSIVSFSFRPDVILLCTFSLVKKFSVKISAINTSEWCDITSQFVSNQSRRQNFNKRTNHFFIPLPLDRHIHSCKTRRNSAHTTARFWQELNLGYAVGVMALKRRESLDAMCWQLFVPVEVSCVKLRPVTIDDSFANTKRSVSTRFNAF